MQHIMTTAENTMTNPTGSQPRQPTMHQIPRWIWLVVGLVIGASATFGISALTRPAAPAGTYHLPASPAAGPATVAAQPSTPPPYMPTAADFTVAIQVTSKHCFGSAGCNVTYRIQPTYVGHTPLDPAQQYTVTYQVTGPKDGPQINSFTIQGTQATINQEEIADVPSSQTQMTAQVTEVLQG